MTHSRRSRAEWDEFAREPLSRRRRALGRGLLSIATVAVLAFALASAVLPSGATGWAIVVALAAAAAWGAVLVHRAERAAKGWGGKPVEARWINAPRRGGRRR